MKKEGLWCCSSVLMSKCLMLSWADTIKSHMWMANHLTQRGNGSKCKLKCHRGSKTENRSRVFWIPVDLSVASEDLEPSASQALDLQWRRLAVFFNRSYLNCCTNRWLHVTIRRTYKPYKLHDIIHSIGRKHLSHIPIQRHALKY